MKNVIAEKTIAYPFNGDFRCRVVLTKRWDDRFLLEVKGLRSQFFNDNCYKIFDTLPIALGEFNVKVIELSN